MKTIIQDFDELTDSREMLEAKGSPFPIYFLYLLFTIILAALIWSYFGEMDEVVKATGVVRPNDKVSTIMTKTVGKAKEIHFNQGKKVKKGDILFILDQEDLLVQQNGLLTEKKKAEKEKDMLVKMKQSVLDQKNYFSPKEETYYREYEKFKLDYEKLKMELVQQMRELEKSKIDVLKAKMEQTLNEEELHDQIDELKGEIENLTLMEKSILEGKNHFTEKDALYYNQYLDYEMKRNQLLDIVEQKKSKWSRSEALGEEYVPKAQIEEERKFWEQAEQDVENHKNAMLLQVREKKKEQERLLKAAMVNLERESQTNIFKMENFLNLQLMENEKYTENILIKMKNDKVVELNQQIKGVEDKIQTFTEELKNVEVAFQDRIIKAPIDGTVNVITEINVGDLVPSGKEILRIIPETDSEYKVLLTVMNKDISAMREGNEIKYHFLALPYTEYGEIKGRVERVSTDAIVSPETGTSFYIVEASIENKPLYSYKGETASIKVGMVSEAYVVTKSKKILYYLLEKLDLRD